MTELDILVPFALPQPELAPDLLRALDAPAFATLLAQAKHVAAPASDGFSRALPHETWLADKFCMADMTKRLGSPPIAVAAMHTAGLQEQTGMWFIVQPVHIHVARDHLVLTDLRQLALTDQDSHTLFDIAKPYFQEVGKSVQYGDAQTWFVRADDWAELQTSTPDATCGHNVDIWMPAGPQAIQWRKLQNEVQMAWHSHPVNDAREQIGLKPVNSIWLWGGAQSSKSLGPVQYQQMFAAPGWMRAFGHFAADSQSAISAEAVIAAASTKGLLTLDSLIEPALAGDWAEWIDRLHRLEHDWFVPMLAALKSGSLTQLSLLLTDTSRMSRFVVTRHSLRKFWVKPALARLLP